VSGHPIPDKRIRKIDRQRESLFQGVIEGPQLLPCGDFHGLELMEVLGAGPGEQNVGGGHEIQVLIHGSNVIDSDLDDGGAVLGAQSEQGERHTEKSILTSFGFEHTIETPFENGRCQLFGGGFPDCTHDGNKGNIERAPPS